jgi:hypothetical protein
MYLVDYSEHTTPNTTLRDGPLPPHFLDEAVDRPVRELEEEKHEG